MRLGILFADLGGMLSLVLWRLVECFQSNHRHQFGKMVVMSLLLTVCVLVVVMVMGVMMGVVVDFRCSHIHQLHCLVLRLVVVKTKCCLVCCYYRLCRCI